MRRTPWTERSFRFDLPPGWMPNVLERLRGTPTRLSTLLAGLDDADAARTHDGAWSVKQHVGHLGDLEVLHDGRIDDLLARAPILRAADMTNRATEVADHNATPLPLLLERFTGSRSAFVRRLEQLDDDTCGTAIQHPRLKVLMRPVDLACFTAEHDDHHLATIRMLLPGR